MYGDDVECREKACSKHAGFAKQVVSQGPWISFRIAHDDVVKQVDVDDLGRIPKHVGNLNISRAGGPDHLRGD